MQLHDRHMSVFFVSQTKVVRDEINKDAQSFLSACVLHENSTSSLNTHNIMSETSN